jgi:hypothetical protein
MIRTLTLAVGVAAGCAVVVGLRAGAGKGFSARLQPSVQQRAGRPSAGEVAGVAQGTYRRAVAMVSAARGTHDAAAGGTPATTGGVIPLETVPIDELSEWELDLLTTPDS